MIEILIYLVIAIIFFIKGWFWCKYFYERKKEKEYIKNVEILNNETMEERLNKMKEKTQTKEVEK